MSEPKKLLIFSTCAYPDPFVRSIRTTQLARYLPEFGWKPIVYARYYGHAASPEDVARDVHPEAEIHHLDKPANPTAGDNVRAKPSLKHRVKVAIAKSPLVQGYAVPDASIRFWRAQRSKALEAVRTHAPDAVFTNAPPISNQDIGLYVKRQTGLPWIADYEDPTLIDKRFGPYGVRKLRRGAHEAYERAIYDAADLITHVIPIHGRWARIAYPGARPKIRELTMACPPDFAEGKIEPDVTPSGRKSIRVVGFMGEQEVLGLARAVRTLVDEGEDLELRLIGRVPATIDQIRSVLGDRAVATGFVPHAEALQQIAGADVLVSYLSPERSTHLLLSSKLFEFFAAGKPVIEINPTRSDRLFLKRVPGVTVLKQPAQADLAAAVKRSLGPDGALPESVRTHFREQRNWRATAEKLAGWLDEIATPGPG